MFRISILALFMISTLSAYAGSESAHSDYQVFENSVTSRKIGPTGSAGDVLDRLVVVVGTAATGTVKIGDGSGQSTIVTAANTPIGVYSVLVGARSVNGGWSITTGAGASAMAVGRFQ